MTEYKHSRGPAGTAGEGQHKTRVQIVTTTSLLGSLSPLNRHMEIPLKFTASRFLSCYHPLAHQAALATLNACQALSWCHGAPTMQKGGIFDSFCLETFMYLKKLSPTSIFLPDAEKCQG